MRFDLLEKFYASEEYKARLLARLNEFQKLDSSDKYCKKRVRDVYSKDPVAFVEQFGKIKIPEYNNAIKPFFLTDTAWRALHPEIANPDCYQKDILWKLLNSETDNKKSEAHFGHNKLYPLRHRSEVGADIESIGNK